MIKLTLKEVLQDALIAEKFMISMYEQFLKEASCIPLLDMLVGHFAELVETQHDIFLAMKDRNFYPVENAELQKIEQTMTLLKQNEKTYTKDFAKNDGSEKKQMPAKKTTDKNSNDKKPMSKK